LHFLLIYLLSSASSASQRRSHVIYFLKVASNFIASFKSFFIGRSSTSSTFSYLLYKTCLFVPRDKKWSESFNRCPCKNPKSTQFLLPPFCTVAGQTIQIPLLP